MSIADTFAAQLAELKQRSDESDRQMAEHIAALHKTLADWELAEQAFQRELAEV